MRVCAPTATRNSRRASTSVGGAHGRVRGGTAGPTAALRGMGPRVRGHAARPALPVAAVAPARRRRRLGGQYRGLTCRRARRAWLRRRASSHGDGAHHLPPGCRRRRYLLAGAEAQLAASRRRGAHPAPARRAGRAPGLCALPDRGGPTRRGPRRWPAYEALTRSPAGTSTASAFLPVGRRPLTRRAVLASSGRKPERLHPHQETTYPVSTRLDFGPEG